MSNFKKYVLDFAVKQINDHTDITVKNKQQKEGRRITGFIFTFKAKAKPKKTVTTKRDSDTPDIFASLTMIDKQRGTFAAKFAQMSKLSDRAK